MNGIFAFVWTDESGYVLKGKCWQEGDPDVLNGLEMRIALLHEPNKEFAKLPTNSGTMLFSRFSEFKDSNRKMRKVIVGMELESKEDPDEYKKLLKEIGKGIEEHIDESTDVFEKILTAFLASTIPSGMSTEEVGDDLQTRMVSKAKAMIGDDKIEEAQDLLEKAKTVPKKLQKVISKGTKLLKQGKIDEASKFYHEAIDMAKSIHEDDLADQLKREYKRASERPKVVENVKKLNEKIRKAIHDENFKRASEIYRTLAKEASKLDDVELMNDYTKMSQLLVEFNSLYTKKRSF